MTLGKTLHILAHGKNLPAAFIDQARALLASLSGDEQAALAAAIDGATRQDDAQAPIKPDTKGK